MVRQDRAEATRQQILWAAAEVFDRVGYVVANLNEIVAAAEVTKGALYFHFESKERLARAVIAARNDHADQVRSALAAADTPVLELLIRQSLRLAVAARDDLFFRAGDRLLDELGDDGADDQQARAGQYRELSALVAQAVEQGDVTAEDPATLAQIMLAQFIGAGVMARSVPGTVDQLTVVESMWSLLIDAVVPVPMRDYFRQVVERTASQFRGQPTISV